MTKPIHVTRSLMPDRQQFHAYVDRILDSGWLTNRGQCVRELEERLQVYLGVRNVVLVNNATSALQVAYKALELHGEVITSPFTFIATASSAQWEGLDVVFADIDPATFCIDVQEIEKKITDETTAIVPVHVFGNPCEVELIEALAEKYGLKVIYDAAHAFNIKYKDESVLNRGDISILSFHATKLFHTIEGGALIINDDVLCEKVRKQINFGFTGPESIECLGINAKMNEFQAAMGLSLLDDMEAVIVRRGELVNLYDSYLGGKVMRQKWSENATLNHGYYPVLFSNEQEAKSAQKALNDKNVFPRRYFFPSLDTLDFLAKNQNAVISRDIASRILCLPLYTELTDEECIMISETIIDCL